MKMLSILGHLLLKVFGWKIKGDIPKDLKKAVIVCGPHTSNWDAYFALSAFYAKKIRIRFLIKKEALFFPLNIVLNGLGALAVDRKKIPQRQNGIVDSVVNIFKSKEKFFLSISPEGTRKYNPNWKHGFYHIAVNAKVPIILAYLDYEKKIAGFGPVFYPTDDIEKDIVEIKRFYSDKKGKYPENGIK